MMHRYTIFCLSFLLLGTSAADAQWFRSGPRSELFWPAPDRGESFLGVYLSEVTADLADLLHLPQERGAHVNQVIANSPAAEAGLEADDVILGWNELPVESARQFTRLVRETPPGREVRLHVFRKGETVELSARIGTQSMITPPSLRDGPDDEEPAWCPALPPPRFFGWPERFAEPSLPAQRPRLGVVMQPLTEQLAGYFGLDDRSGALVSSVVEGSPADEQGVRAGDVILSVAGADTESPTAVQQAVANTRGAAFELVVMRDREVVEIQIPAEDVDIDVDASADADPVEDEEPEETYPIDSL